MLPDSYNRTYNYRQWNAVGSPDDGHKDARNMLRYYWLPINHYLLHLVGLTFTYLSKMHGHSNIKFSELRSVLQGLIPELILSQKCNTVYVHMGPICNGCWFRNSWSVAVHFTRFGVNNTRNSHLRDRDNPHGTVESNYQHLFAVNVWCGVVDDQLIGPYILPQRLTGDVYANYLQTNCQHSYKTLATLYRHYSGSYRFKLYN